MKKKVSVVIGYYNRKSLLINTLNKFNQMYKDYNFEVIITDDKSNQENTLDDIINNYNFKIILLKVLDKDWINPCVAYNLAIQNISHDTEFIIIQNPEIYHCTNIFDIVLKDLKEGLYLTFPIISSINDEQTNKYINMTHDELEKNILAPGSRISRPGKNGGWYNHPDYRRRNLHFLSAIHINDLKKIGGFNNEFKDGAWYDDDELLLRIQKVCKVNCIHPKKNIDDDLILGLHQYHAPLTTQNGTLRKKNEILFSKLKSNIKKKDFNVYCDLKLDINYKLIHNKHITLN
tara:strand:+ start:6135 stop:7004 length:870 start_codon:yes stop_codon:yes gene_type:complete